MYRPSSDPTRRNQPTSTQPATTPKTTKPKKPKNPFTPNDPDSPFNDRRERIFNMNPGKPRTEARQDLRADLRTWREKQQEARESAYNPADWGDPNTYVPWAEGQAPTFDSGGFGLDPSHTYGNPANSYLNTGVGRAWVSQNPQAYHRLAQAQAGNPTDQTTAYGRYLNDQYYDLYSNYQAAQGISPNLTFDKYLQPVIAQQERQYRESPFQLRGDVPMVLGGATYLGGF